MGTSLSGLTPATTFDGLLKTSDNEPLDGTLKAISTGDGTDTMLELSTTALQIGGATGMYWDNTNKRLGIATDAPSVPFEVYGGVRFRDSLNLNGTLTNSSSGEVNINNLGFFDAVSSKVGIGENTPTSRLHIKGSGATSATTSLLVQNSAGTQALKVTDDGAVAISDDGIVINGQLISRSGTKIQLGAAQLDYQVQSAHTFKTYNGTSYTEVMRITGNTADQFVGIGETTPTARLHIKGSGNDNTTTSLLVQNSDGTEHLKITDDGSLTYRTSERVLLTLGNGSVLKYGNNSSFSALYNRASIYDGTNTTQFENGNVGIGNNTTTPTARLQVKGSGATSATKALIVQNSGGETMFSVRDDKTIQMDGSRFTFNSSAFTSYADILLNTDLAVGTTTIAANTRAHIKGSGNDATTTALLVQNSDGTNLFKVDDSGIGVLVNDDQAGYIRLSASGEYGTIGGGRILRITSGGANPLMISGSGSNGVVIGSTSATTLAANTALAVKGQGATSATTALLVQNSAGTEHFKIDDVGVTSITSASQSVPLFVNASGSATAGIELRALSARRFRILATSTITTLETTNTKGISTNASLNVGSGYTGADASAVLQADSTTQGFLPPRMTTTERDAITTPAAGLMVYNTTTNKAQCYNGTTWNDLF